MVRYKYVARNDTGNIVRGTIEAENTSSFFEQLERAQLLCLEYSTTIAKSAAVKTIYKLKNKDLILFCRKLSTMLSAGMSMTNCVDILVNTAEKPKLAKVYLHIYESLKGGKPLSVALRDCGHSFPPLLINMLESGEESGNIDAICSKLSRYYEKQGKIAAKIKSATTYPKVLAAVSFGVILILFIYVLPQIFSTFGDIELPKITQFMLLLSNLLVKYWYFVIFGFILFFAFIKFLFSIDQVKFLKDKFVIRIPKIGYLVKKIYSARFANTLAILYSSGLSLINALHLSANVVGNTYIEKRLGDTTEKISMGNTLSDSLADITVFDSMLPGMVKIGEETGSLDNILISVSEYYEQETDAAIESLLAIVEPVLLVVMAIVIGTIMISVFVPILSSYTQYK